MTTTVMRRWSRHLARLGRAIGGTAAVEFGLAAPILMGLLVPVADLGIAFAEQMQVQQAAQAGAQYALLHGYDSTAISSAVSHGSTLSGVSASPAPSQSCGCPTGSAISAVTCGTTCSNGEIAGSYVFVNSQAVYTPVLPYSLLGDSVTLAAQTAVRVQ